MLLKLRDRITFHHDCYDALSSIEAVSCEQVKPKLFTTLSGLATYGQAYKAISGATATTHPASRVPLLFFRRLQRVYLGAAVSIRVLIVKGRRDDRNRRDRIFTV